MVILIHSPLDNIATVDFFTFSKAQQRSKFTRFVSFMNIHHATLMMTKVVVFFGGNFL